MEPKIKGPVKHSPPMTTTRMDPKNITFDNIQTITAEIEPPPVENPVVEDLIGAVGGIETTVEPLKSPVNRNIAEERIIVDARTPQRTQQQEQSEELVNILNQESEKKRKRAMEEKNRKLAQQQQERQNAEDKQQKEEAEYMRAQQKQRDRVFRRKQQEERVAADKKKKSEMAKAVLDKKKKEEEVKKQKALDERNKRIEERRQRTEYFEKCKQDRRMEEEQEKQRIKLEDLERQRDLRKLNDLRETREFEENRRKHRQGLEMYKKAEEQEREYKEAIKKQEATGATLKSIYRNPNAARHQACNIDFENDTMDEDDDSQVSQNIHEEGTIQNESVTHNSSPNESIDEELIEKISLLNSKLKNENDQKTRYEKIKEEKLQQDRLFERIEHSPIDDNESIDIFLSKLFNVSEQDIKNQIDREPEIIIENENLINQSVNDCTKFNKTNKFINCSEVQGKNNDNSLNINLTLKAELFDKLKDQNKFNNEVIARFSDLIDNSSIKFAEYNNKIREISLKFFNLFYNVFKFQNECIEWVNDILNSEQFNYDILTNEIFKAFIESLHVPKFTNIQISDLYGVFSKIFDPFFCKQLFFNYFGEFNNISDKISSIYNIQELNTDGESVLKCKDNCVIPNLDSGNNLVNTKLEKLNILNNKELPNIDNNNIGMKNEIVQLNTSEDLERIIGVGSREDIGLYRAKALSRKAIEAATKIKYPEIFKVFVTINNKTAIGILDSGASASIITQEGAEFFNIKVKNIEKGIFSSVGIGGKVDIEGISGVSVALHDLQFPTHSFRVINTGNPDYFITLGSDFLKNIKLIINCAHKSVGRQIAPNVFWELLVNVDNSSCRRRIVNLPIYLQHDLKPSEGQETITDFNIILPDVNIIKNFNCKCSNETINKLNNFVYFSADKLPSKNLVEDNNVNNDIFDELLIDNVMTNIHCPQFSISNPSLIPNIVIPRGIVIGKITSPLCKVNGANLPIRLNNNLGVDDFNIDNEQHISNYNKIKLENKETLHKDKIHELNYVKNVEILYSICNTIKPEEARYDFRPPEEKECNREDEEDLPTVDYWTRDTLNEVTKIESKDEKERQEIQDLLFEFKEVFSEGEFFDAATLPELTVELTDEVPIFVPQFKLSPPMEAAVQEQIDELIKHKLVEPSTSRYNFPVLPVRKRVIPGQSPPKIRVVLDLRLLNQKAIKFEFPLPDISIVLQTIGGFSLYTSMDLANSFWQCPLSENSRDYMSFSSGKGRYRLTRSPQGFINTAAHFQSCMGQVFGELLFPMSLPVKTVVNGEEHVEMVSRTRFLAYIDDLVCVAETFEIMKTILRLALEKVRKYNLKLKLKKCVFNAEKIDLLGHEISPKGIRKQPRYVEKVMEVELPKTVADLLRFMGMANWVSKFVKDFSEVARPLILLQKTDKVSMKQTIEWNPERLESFRRIKELICEDITLAYPLPEETNGPLHLFCDSSQFCIGSYIGQYQEVINEKGEKIKEMRVIGNYSCPLDKAERFYNTREKELCSIRHSLRHFRPYIIGKKIFIWTDHRSLCYMHSMKLINARLYRTAQEMECYDYTICYIPGRENNYADLLSRIGYDEMIKNATKLEEEKLPEGLTVKLIPGGGDSMVHCLSLQELEWKKEEKTVSKFIEHTEDDIDKLRQELWKHISENPGHYGINFTPEKRKGFQVYRSKDYPLTDEFLQCFANKKRCIVELYFSNTKPIVFKPFTDVKNDRIVRIQLKGIDHFNLLLPISEVIDPVQDCMFYDQVKDITPINKELITVQDGLNRNFSNKPENCNYSIPIECYALNNCDVPIKQTDSSNQIIQSSNDLKFQCKHYGENISVGYITFGLKNGISVCALYDSCASLSMISASLAQYLEEQGLLIYDAKENISLIGMGGIKVQVSVQYVFASANITSSWSIPNTRWAVMDDDKLPACVIIGFDFLAQNNINLDFHHMKICSPNGHSKQLGRSAELLPEIRNMGNGAAEVIILTKNKFSNEITVFESNIPEEKISIPKQFQEHFEIDLKNLLNWQKDVNQEFYSNKKTFNYDVNDIPVDKLNPHKFVKFQNNIQEINKENVDNNLLIKEIKEKIHGLLNLKELEIYSKLPLFLRNICETMEMEFKELLKNLSTKLEDDWNDKPVNLMLDISSNSIRLLPIKINWDLVRKVKFIDGAKANNLKIYDNPDHIVRFMDKIEVVPDLDFIKKGNIMYQLPEEESCEDSEEVLEEGDTQEKKMEINNPELIVLWNNFNNPRKGQNISRDKLIKDVYDIPDVSITDGRNFINEQFNITQRTLNMDPDEIDAIKKIQEKSEDIRLLRQKIENEDFSDWKNPKLRKYYSSRKKFYINSDILVWHRPYDNKILPVVNDNYMLSVIIVAHIQAHKGARKLEMEIKNSYFCPGIVNKTKDVTSSCFLCQINKVHGTRNHERNPPKHITAENSLDLCYGDITFLERSGGNIGIFNIVDVASRKVFSVPIKNRLASTLIKAFDEKIKPLLYGGHISLLRLDNAREHHSKEFIDYFKDQGTKIIYGIPNKSSSGGMIERFNATLKEKLKMKPRNINNKDWTKYHHVAVEDYNNTYHESTGQTPNRRFVDRFPDTSPTFRPNTEQKKKLINEFPIISYFKNGDKVLFQIPRVGRLNVDALQPYYEGPYTIKKITVPNKCFIIQNDSNKDIEKRADHDQLRKFKIPPKYLQNLPIFQELMMPYHPKYLPPNRELAEKTSVAVTKNLLSTPGEETNSISPKTTSMPTKTFGGLSEAPMWEIMEIPKPNTDSERESTETDSDSNINESLTRGIQTRSKRKLSLENKKKLFKELDEKKSSVKPPSKLKAKIDTIHRNIKDKKNSSFIQKKGHNLCTSTGTESAIEEEKEESDLHSKLIHQNLNIHNKNNKIKNKRKNLKLLPYRKSVKDNHEISSISVNSDNDNTNPITSIPEVHNYTEIDENIKTYKPNIFPIINDENSIGRDEIFTPLSKYRFSTPVSTNYSVTPPPIQIPDIPSIKKYNWDSLNELNDTQLREILSPNPLPEDHPFIGADRVSRKLDFEGHGGGWVDNSFKIIDLTPLRKKLINTTLTRLSKSNANKKINRNTFTIKTHQMRTRLDLICYSLDMRLGYYEQLPMK
ncbi:unnamed protein product [Rotaria socialis]|uniref:RNA-directed DNA polymerase n=1 Tax=Rotaria socialis TaxID=392032 RepID=A0A818Y337_9BILA|nr:unnamed protein product [Rotaria socialis]